MGAGKSRLRRALIVVETALAVILLSGAALLATSYLKLQQVDPGFEAGDLQAVEVGVSVAYPSPERRVGYFEELLREVEALPGVDSASFVSIVRCSSADSARL